MSCFCFSFWIVFKLTEIWFRIVFRCPSLKVFKVSAFDINELLFYPILWLWLLLLLSTSVHSHTCLLFFSFAWRIYLCMYNTYIYIYNGYFLGCLFSLRPKARSRFRLRCFEWRKRWSVSVGISAMDLNVVMELKWLAGVLWMIYM